MQHIHSDKIVLNDLLRLDDLKNVKVRLLLYAGRNDSGRGADFIQYFQEGNMGAVTEGLFWNYNRNKSYREGDIAVGLASIEKDHWLLFSVSRVTKDLNRLNAVGYEHVEIEEFNKYLGRVVIRYRNKSQNLVRRAESIMHDLVVEKILPDVFNDDIFPGYENVRLSWKELKNNIKKETWKTALENQKGVYLILDKATGRKYIGSAYGEDMILGRWRSYVKTGHGGNRELKNLTFEYIQSNFQYSILDIYKSAVDDDVIIKREAWWKSTLMTRDSNFGYNKN